ncbi:uncharacterized protein MYCGRDRAFT_97798 [Zymoseptoria tritici IPO323]|uniref:Uncharacterized protein n=1 Tax=Zymoseptoria tritici (strain CBS 115943 / IPO323) TaxID=336722 RepID=F9XRE6_ZYMTI|nr:uncharacterized protein MYCGRDRAFT_97798 [Zymoseptoria tritici IPO323]EGP82181.1 hypothetical protein MYCGRDRAFT_97798 [Zymoseptoria tritici IPO323]
MQALCLLPLHREVRTRNPTTTLSDSLLRPNLSARRLELSKDGSERVKLSRLMRWLVEADSAAVGTDRGVRVRWIDGAVVRAVKTESSAVVDGAADVGVVSARVRVR